MPRGSGNYVSLPDSNADEHYENSNSNESATTVVGVAVPPTAAAAGVGQNGRYGGAARAAPESSYTGAGAEAGSTYPNISSPSDSRGDPSPASSRGNTKSAQQAEDEATPLNLNEASAAAAAAAAGTEKADASSKSNPVIDPTGGLPTAEGVFVGSPIAQTSYSQAPTVSGAWASGTQSNAGIVAGPPSYNAHVTAAAGGGAGGGAVVVMPGGAQIGGLGRGPGGENRTVILVNSPRFFEWGRQPQPFTCQSCSFSGFSSTTSVSFDGFNVVPDLSQVVCPQRLEWGSEGIRDA